MVDHMILTSARQAWPPFVLVTGLLLIGAVAAADGLFEALGARLLPPWIAACAITASFLVLAFRLEDHEPENAEPPPLRIGIGAVATLAAAVLVVSLQNAAVPVLSVGLAATALRRLRPRVDVRVLAPLFAVAVGVGTGARLWHGPVHLLAAS